MRDPSDGLALVVTAGVPDGRTAVGEVIVR